MMMNEKMAEFVEAQEAKFKRPSDDTRYMCDDGHVRTWDDLTWNLGPEDYPSTQDDVELLLWAYGAKEIAAPAA